MNAKMFDSLNKWVESGRRSVDIEITSIHGDVEIKTWCYDYNISMGKLISEESEIPTTESLIERKKKMLLEQLEGI